MSDPKRPPHWKQHGHHGAAQSGVVLGEATIAWAYNVQGDAARAPFGEEIRTRFGVALPTVPNTLERNGIATALWLGPRSWLLLSGSISPIGAFDSARHALNAAGGALFDVSASRIAWTVRGPQSQTVLAKSCPLDFDRRAFAPQTCAQSTLGHVNALFVREGDGFTVLVARSFARDVWHALTESAAQYGYDVAPQAPYRTSAPVA